MTRRGEAGGRGLRPAPEAASAACFTPLQRAAFIAQNTAAMVVAIAGLMPNHQHARNAIAWAKRAQVCLRVDAHLQAVECLSHAAGALDLCPYPRSRIAKGDCLRAAADLFALSRKEKPDAPRS